jgi:hypothetical protein
LEGVRQSILQWQVGFEGAIDYLMPTAPIISDFIKYLDNDFDYNKMLEKILTQKYVATFWVGVESWVDYRRTGYPFLIPVAYSGSAEVDINRGPQRMPYPAAEYTDNLANVQKAVSDYLQGPDNLATKLWWACKPGL